LVVTYFLGATLFTVASKM